MTLTDTDRKTIDDFGQQWTRYSENSGWLASQECFRDLFGALLSVDELKGKVVADIGSGTGRIVQMLLAADVAQVIAIEPSASFEVLKKAVHGNERVVLVNETGEAVLRYPGLDFVVSFGVLHHVVDPSPIVRAAYQALRPGGRIVVWLYGHEGNGLYLAVSSALRTVTKRLPDSMLAGVTSVLNVMLGLYIWLCRYLPLPMRSYMLNHLGKVEREVRKVTIFDQLNPAYAKYYREAEARSLIADAGFVDVQLYHRHGYSWTVMGTKPQ